MNRRRVVRWLLLGAVFCWLAFVYASFYLVQQQRPFAAYNLVAGGSAVLDAAVAAWILAAGIGTGYQVCRRLGIHTGRAVEDVVWSAGLGLGIAAVGVLVLGVLGWATRWAIVGWLSALTLLGLQGILAMAPALAEQRSFAAPPRGLRAYLLVMLALTALLALTPPVDWDGLFYHLTLPRLYLAQGRIAPTTDMPTRPRPAA